MTTAEVLEAAAYRLELRGWCQRIFELPDGRCCATRAIRRSASNDREALKAIDCLARALRAPEPLGPSELPLSELIVLRWNDQRFMTRERVVAGLKRAAQLAAPGPDGGVTP